MNAANRSHFVYVIFIRTTPAKLWEALTEPQSIRRYWFNTTVECEWRKGSPWKMARPDGSLTDSGEILEVDRPESELIRAVSSGWPRILSNLKSLLETGEIAITSHPGH